MSSLGACVGEDTRRLLRRTEQALGTQPLVRKAEKVLPDGHCELIYVYQDVSNNVKSDVNNQRGVLLTT